MLIAGPCAIESRAQAHRIARFVRKCGAKVFRGGAWKGQNRPIIGTQPAYWGLGKEAVDILVEIQDVLYLPCVTEVQSIEQLDMARDLKYLQVGARHMQNFPLLKALKNNYKGKIILKRGLGNTVDEWIGAAEHLGGPKRVILCARGVTHFDRTPLTRWRLDFVGVAYVKTLTKYRVIMDPSHGSGDRRLILPLAKAILPLADGLMVEVHYDPDYSPTDAKQTVGFPLFEKIAKLYKKVKND